MKSTRLAVPLALALCFAAPEAKAQFGSNTDALVFSILIAPPALAALICDVVSIATLTNGYAYRGSAVTGTVFGGVTTLLSFLALAAGLSSSTTWEFWVPVGSTGIALGLASVLLNVYGITRPPPDPNKATGVDINGRQQVRAPGAIQFTPTIYTARGGLGLGGVLNVAL